jgi:phosphoribosylaminoimidazolecarboxamide formyltransferase/IMP cyclohydrolase
MILFQLKLRLSAYPTRPVWIFLNNLVPGLTIFSTGGTFSELQGIIKTRNLENLSLVQVSDYTGQPETQGGLVKTLDFKIYLGLLTETYNDAHQNDLKRTSAVPIDLVICNLYPFSETITKEGCTFEDARGNIDIGGPAMIRAAAKNFLRVAPIVNPADYAELMNELRDNKGYTSFDFRFHLMKMAYKYTGQYDQSIAAYLYCQRKKDIHPCYHE